MYREKVEKLQELRTNFNIFSASSPVPAELLHTGCLPPLPVMGNYLVWGFQVLKAAVREGADTLACVSIDGAPEGGLKLALTLENRADRYTWREKADILACIRYFPEMDPGEDLLSLVQTDGSFIPPTEIFLKLPEHVRKAVDSGLIDIKTGERIADLPGPAFTLLLPILRTLSFSSRRQFLLMLTETAKRDRLGGAEIAAFADTLLTSPAPLEQLKHRRYPQLTRMEQRLEEYRGKYLRGTGIECVPPPNFEGEDFTLRFRWKSEEQLHRTIANLSRLKGTGHELFELLH
jgi:hypothetical protein